MPSTLIAEQEAGTPPRTPSHPADRRLQASPVPSVLGALVAKEIHDLILTLRFTVGSLIAVTLAVLAAYIGSLDYNTRLDSYQTKLKLNRDALSQTTVYSFLSPTLVRPPEPLSILNHGLEGRVGTDFQVAVDREETEATGENRGNEYLAVFSELDLTVIVAVILGLLALLFTFDAVCGEREAGMLKLMTSYPLARWQILLGKFFGAWLTLMLPTTLACLVSLLVMGFTAHVHFGPQEAVRIILIFSGYGLYLSLMLLVGLVISSFVQHSPIALIFATFLWFFFATIVPNLATMMPDFVGNRASVFQRARQGLQQADREEEAAVERLKDPRNPDSEQPRDPGVLYHYAINNNWGGLTQFECSMGDRKFYDQVQGFFGQLVPISLRFASRRAEAWRQYIRYRERQAAMARALSFLSPSAVFQNTLGFVSGTSDLDYEHFIDLAREYRNTFLGYLSRKNAVASYRWFTVDPGDGSLSWTLLYVGKTADEMAASGEKAEDVLNRLLRDEAGRAKFEQFFQEREKDPKRFLPLRDLPAFTYARVGVGGLLVHAAPEITYLLGLNLVLFLVAFTRFVRYDVR